MIEQMQTFRMAPMDRENKMVTAVSLALSAAICVAAPLAMLAGAFNGGGDAGKAALAFVIIAAFVAVVFATVCLYRPSRLEVSPLGVRIAVRIRWPLRSRLISPEDIESVERVDYDRTLQPYRVWAFIGGVFGTFGVCRHRQFGLVDTYVTSRTDAVLITRRQGQGRPLLITPDRPDEFVTAVRAILTAPGV